MRLGLISDIHSNSIALERVLERFADEGVESILCAGDLVGYGSQPNRTIRLLRIADVKSILGNHDEGILHGTPTDFNVYAKRALDWNRRHLEDENKEYLESLPEERKLKKGSRSIFMAHGTPKNPLTGYLFQEDVNRDFLEFSFNNPPDVLVMGQTHIPYIEHVGNTMIINPGSVGQPRDGDTRASCAIYDTDQHEGEILRVNYDQKKMYEDMIEYLPKRLAERVLKGE
jgi:putative phosphoesterase